MTTKPTNAQLIFASTMTKRQWGALRGLCVGPCYLSASERGDPEIYALIENKLAQCNNGIPDGFGLASWYATTPGKVIMRKRIEGMI